ncbi:hypothetical protein [Sphingomonas sp. UYP23]
MGVLSIEHWRRHRVSLGTLNGHRIERLSKFAFSVAEARDERPIGETKRRSPDADPSV